MDINSSVTSDLIPFWGLSREFRESRDLLIRMGVQKLRLKFVHGCILKMFLQSPLATSQRRGRPFLISTPSLEADSTKPASPCRILFLVRYLMLFLPVGVLRTRTRRYSNWPPNHHISL